MRALPATDPSFEHALLEALEGGNPLAPLPPQPDATLRMLQPETPLETDAALIVATSGSTGTPKGVMLSREAITAGAQATHEWLGGPGDWTLALPAHYVAGVMVLARAQVAGTRVLHADAHLEQLPHLEPGTRNYLSVVPTQLVRALDNPTTVERLAAYDRVLLGGAAAGADLLARCERAGIKIATTYGMSETSGGCFYNQTPLPGVQVEVDADQRVHLTGPMAFSGYRLQPELTAQTLTGRTVHTNDRGRWDGTHLQILGRLDDVVISGGLNVDLAEVERALKALAPDAVALGVPDAKWGTRVIAATTANTTLTKLRNQLTGLDAPALPRGLMRPNVLPLTSSGKINRQALIAAWADDEEKEEL